MAIPLPRRASQPILLPPAGAAYPRASGAPASLDRVTCSRGRSGRGTVPLSQPQPLCPDSGAPAAPGPRPRESLLRVSASHGRRPQAAVGGTAARAGPGSGRPRAAPSAPRARSPRPAPLGPRRCARRSPRPRRARPAPCALLTSFILPHTLARPLHFQTVTHPPAGWRLRLAACGSPGAQRSSKNRCDFLRSKSQPTDPPRAQPLKMQRRKDLARRADRPPGRKG